MRRRSRVLALVVLPVCLLLSGCTGGPGAAPPTSAADVPEPGTPLPGALLIGTWRVGDAGEDAATWVRFTGGDFSVERHRRVIGGAWTTGDDQLVATVEWFDGRVGDPAVPWLTGAHSFVQEGDAVVLRSAAGARLAVLTPDASPPRALGSSDFDAVPTAGPADGPRMTAPTPAATPGPPLTAGDLQGRWVTGTATADETRPMLALRADGTYRTSDGCNGSSGGWRLLPGNRLLTTAGASALTSCVNLVPVQNWIGGARSASVIDGRLTLFDGSGAALGSLERG